MSSSTLADGIRLLRGKLAAQQHNDDTDEQLLQSFLHSRDDGAFAVLVRRHGPMVLRVCRRVLGHQQDAEDAFQATFLVLARRAAALRNKTSLAGFLHGTAYRIALKAKQTAARRRKYEGQAPTQSPADPAEELSWREVRTLLDEELARLSEKYRSAFILCCLEELSRTEAARRLRLKEGTLIKRLAVARKRLRQRLAQRGVELTEVLAAMALEARTAKALPHFTESAVSPAVAVLANSTSPILHIGKIKLAALVLLTVAAGASLMGSYPRESEPPADKTAEQPTPPPKLTNEDSKVIHGRVLAPDGKPKAGAKLLLLGEDRITELGVSAADGRFTVSIPKAAKDRRFIARTEDTGIDFVSTGNLKPEKTVELRLVKDRPIRGRIVTTEGKPVAGAHVTVGTVRVYANNSLDSFFIAWHKRRGNSEMPDGVKRIWTGKSGLFAATTDGDGRFIIRGIGAERIAYIEFHGPGIATAVRWVINRDGFDPTPFHKELRTGIPQRVMYGPWTMMTGPDPSIVADSEKIIRGVVKAADTGKGQAGVTVWLLGSGGADLFGGLLEMPLQTRTDAAGRYEIRGARKMKSYMLQVLKNPATGYLGGKIRVEDTSGYQPVTAVLTVKKGVIVTGRVIDRATGKPVPGDVQTAVLNGNPFAKEYLSDIGMGMVERVETGKDGVFRDVVIPGPVLLMGDADFWRLPGGEIAWMGYKPPVPDPDYPQYFEMKPNGRTDYLGHNGGPGAVHGKSCKVLNAKPGTVVVHQDLYLERESVRRVTIQDAEGRPLTGVWATGIRPETWNDPVRISGDSCPAYGVDAGKSRLMVFYHRERKLAGILTLKGGEKGPMTAKLRPMGSIRGRLLDANGKPLPGVSVVVRIRDGAAESIHEFIHETKQAVTDAAGAFALDELIPEAIFELSFQRGQRHFERQTTAGEAASVQVKAGERRDLGDVRVKSPKK